MAEFTPMMRQYLEIKEQYKDCILFFRLGDFYEMFFDDAILASREMEVTLTGKNCGMEERAPMCGVPYHAADTYITKLIEKGYKVAICEQVEEPAVTKGIVKREVIRVITPGTVLSGAMLNEKENNYLASIYIIANKAGISYCDISTGEISTTELNGDNCENQVFNELAKINPREAILNKSFAGEEISEEISAGSDTYFTILEDEYFSFQSAEETILRHFKLKSLKGIGLEDKDFACSALGCLISYMKETQKQELLHIINVKVYDSDECMSLDKATIKNLELTETLFDKKVQGSILGVLDKTQTAMGSRKLKQWIRQPLNTLMEISERLDAVEVLTDDIILRNDIREYLKGIYDLERLSGRIACGNANARDLIALKNSVSLLPDLKASLAGTGNILLEELEKKINRLTDVYNKIEASIVDDPPFIIKEGGIIKGGYAEELDQLKASIRDGQEWILNLEATEKARTGIKSLKVGFNKVFGYYIDITKSYYDMIPENYIRKQTLVNSERFITAELKEVESVVLNAETKINQLEYELFADIRDFIRGYITHIQKTADSIAQLDVLMSFAETGSKNGYVKPEITDSDQIVIQKGRHPVLEQIIRNALFVSNDTYINRSDSSMLIITGPNMAGKSTYMRQTALIVLMAQIGCFVPADKAEIGIVDRIYTRIGASDNLTQGQSTFYVEMSELAYILNTATEKSLVILDEIGRGTSTYDGLSIAWAVIEYLCRKQNRIRTLFATHYHELTALEDSIPGVKNLNVGVSDVAGNIVFLHKILEGSASRSYGIHVAKLAGVPLKVLETAQDKLDELENKAFNIELKSEHVSEKQFEMETEQLSFFNFVPDPVVKKLKSLDLMNITPSQAFIILEELKDAAEKDK